MTNGLLKQLVVVVVVVVVEVVEVVADSSPGVVDFAMLLPERVVGCKTPSIRLNGWPLF